jgi:hypothetical protein
MRTRNHRVFVRLDDTEHRRFLSLVKRSGFSQQAYLRALIAGIVPNDKPPPDYYAMRSELYAIGNNLNQIARKANATGNINASSYEYEVTRLDEAISHITDEVSHTKRTP